MPPPIVDIDAITVEVITKTLRAWQQGQTPPPDLLALDLLSDAATGTTGGRDIRLRDLLLGLTTAELARARQLEDVPEPAAPITRQTLLSAVARDFTNSKGELQAWSALYHRYLAPVELSAEELAVMARVDPRHFRRLVDAGARRLTDRLRRAELAAHVKARANQLSRHLPPPDYSQLFGIDAPRTELAGLLRRPDGPRIISIEGLGGIGKTALARAVASDLAGDNEFDGITWISARQSRLTESGNIETTTDAAITLADIIGRLAEQLGLAALVGLGTDEKLAHIAGFLANTRYLIVVDNLESVRDVDALLPALITLAAHVRILLTTRQAVTGYPLVQRRAVEPLSLEDSRALIEAELNRHRSALKLDPDDMRSLFAVVGGMPLALRLVAAQLGRRPLPLLLADMQQVHRRAPESLYTYIYRQAWLDLADPARAMLLSLLHIAPEGEDLEWLQLMTALPPDEFDDALGQLLTYSLLDVAGSAAAPHYRMHRLTITFLQTEILSRWEG